MANIGGKACKAEDMAGYTVVDAVVVYWTIMALLYINFVLSAIPKNGASIIGVIFSGITSLISIMLVFYWMGKKLDLAIGAFFMLIFSFLLIAAAIVKLVFTAGDKKMNRLNRR